MFTNVFIKVTGTRVFVYQILLQIHVVILTNSIIQLHCLIKRNMVCMTVTLGGNTFHEYFLQYSSQFAQCTSIIPYRPTLMLPLWMFSIVCICNDNALFVYYNNNYFFNCRLSICICIILMCSGHLTGSERFWTLFK